MKTPVSDRWYRGRLWKLALEHGCKVADLKEAYGVSDRTIDRYIRRYEAYAKKAAGQGQGG